MTTQNEQAWQMLAAAAAPQEPQEHSSAPSGYAYRYPDGIRFNDGCEVNGCRPSESIPYYFAAQAPSVVPVAPLPHPGSPEASAMLDSLLAEYNWPTNTKNAARAGWEAARRWLASPPQRPAQPAEERAAFENSSFDCPPITATLIRQLQQGTEHGLTTALQEYFWECGFNGWMAARAAQSSEGE